MEAALEMDADRWATTAASSKRKILEIFIFDASSHSTIRQRCLISRGTKCYSMTQPTQWPVHT